MPNLARRPLFPGNLSFGAVAFVLAFPVQAEFVTDTIPLMWQCIQTVDAQFNVACRPMQAATSFELDERIPTEAGRDKPPAASGLQPVAQRGAAEVFSAPAWLIPLHVAPADAAHVQLLLESVLCGAQLQCRVTYSKQTGIAVPVTLAGR